MKFVYPAFLWALLALAIPVIIHLFNFRKYKTLYFSSLKFIQHVDQQTRSTQKLKHLLVLIARLLALAALIVGFAQPYLPVKNNGTEGGKPVMAIYIDNSFSMTATTEIYKKMGHPGLGSKIYFMKDGKKIYGKVSLLSFCGFKGAKNGLILIGIEPFKKVKLKLKLSTWRNQIPFAHVYLCKST
jgi:hypothetical protein